MRMASDPEKNDFQNARKRGLHGWAQWRTDINDRLSQSNKSGQPVNDIAPIQRYLKKQLPYNHPLNKPKMLMSYSGDIQNPSCLSRDDYLVYGIPRAKLNPKTALTASVNNLNSGHHSRNIHHRHHYNSDSSNQTSSSGSPRNTLYNDQPEGPSLMVQSMADLPRSGYHDDMIPASHANYRYNYKSLASPGDSEDFFFTESLINMEKPRKEAQRRDRNDEKQETGHFVNRESDNYHYDVTQAMIQLALEK